MTVKVGVTSETLTGPPTSLSFILVFPTDPGINFVVDPVSEAASPDAAVRWNP
jgi:hypothetical protein